MVVKQLLTSITAPRAAQAAAVRRHLDDLTKPKGSLGRLESVAMRLARIYGDPPRQLHRRAILLCAADHGVAMRGVSAYPQSVTSQMCTVLGHERAGINTIARAVNALVIPVDVGVNAPAVAAGLVNRRVRAGTRDFTIEDAMTADELAAAVAAGYQIANAVLIDRDIIGLGEVGIGNTTAAAALTARLTGSSIEQVVGRGTGIDDAALAQKRAVVESALRRLPNDADALAALQAVGGLEIAALVGVIAAAAVARKAVVLDGFVSTTAALVAVHINPALRHYCFAAHLSPEPGHAVQLRSLRLRPLLRLQMRLGEGTGAALAMPILDAAARLLCEMATFSDAGVARALAPNA